jgi:RNA polymerase sigma factor (sigma-70 family)
LILRSLSPITDIFLACRAQLARAVSRIVPPQDIEDIVQTTYVRVCQYNARNPIGEPKALMLSVARNLALDHIKRAENRLTIRIESDADLESALARQAGDDSFNTVASHEEFSQFCDAVRQLPVQCRRVFVLKKIYGYSQREVATELGIAESTVEKHIASGMQHCTRYMKEQAQAKKRAISGQRRVVSATGSRS